MRNAPDAGTDPLVLRSWQKALQVPIQTPITMINVGLQKFGIGKRIVNLGHGTDAASITEWHIALILFRSGRLNHPGTDLRFQIRVHHYDFHYKLLTFEYDAARFYVIGVLPTLQRKALQLAAMFFRTVGISLPCSPTIRVRPALDGTDPTDQEDRFFVVPFKYGLARVTASA
jgi:hypothetical protein